MRRTLTPLGALVRGLLAGAAGAAAQTVIFKLTGPLAPSPPAGAFSPPEPQQHNEGVTETVARRVVEQLAQRGPLTSKSAGGMLVHHAFGAAWGGLYGLARESHPALRGAAWTLGFSTAVWMLSDNVILPLFRLSAWPAAYPPRVHLYAWAAHVVYGAALAGSYVAMRPLAWPALAAGAWAYHAKRRLPARLRPVLGRAVDAAGAFRGLAHTARSHVLH